jgi:hypothetical protein
MLRAKAEWSRCPRWGACITIMSDEQHEEPGAIELLGGMH